MFDDVMAQIEARAKRFGPMRDANGYAKIHGSCDDTAEIWLRIDGGKIRKGSYMTDGCGYSRHCCYTAVALAEGMKTEDAAQLTQSQVLDATGPLPEDHQHCALLAADTIRGAVANYLKPEEKKTFRTRIKKILGREQNHA